MALPYWAQCRTLARFFDRRYDVPSLLVGNHLRHQAAALPAVRRYYLAEDSTFNDSPVFYKAADGAAGRASHCAGAAPENS